MKMKSLLVLTVLVMSGSCWAAEAAPGQPLPGDANLFKEQGLLKLAFNEVLDLVSKMYPVEMAIQLAAQKNPELNPNAEAKLQAYVAARVPNGIEPFHALFAMHNLAQTRPDGTFTEEAIRKEINDRSIDSYDIPTPLSSTTGSSAPSSSAAGAPSRPTPPLLNGPTPPAPPATPPTMHPYMQKLRAILHQMNYMPRGKANWGLIALTAFLLLHGGDKWADASSAITDFEERLELIRSYIEKKHGAMPDDELQELVDDNNNGMAVRDRRQIRRYFALQDELKAAKNRRSWARWETALGALVGGGTAFKHYRESQVLPAVA